MLTIFANLGKEENVAARARYLQSLDIHERLGNQAGIAQTLGKLGRLAYNEDKLAEAEKLYKQASDIQQNIGDIINASIQMFNLARLYEKQERLTVPLLERAVAVAQRTNFYEAERWTSILARVREKLTRGRDQAALDD